MSSTTPLALSSTSAPAEKRKLGRALSVSIAAHAGFAALLVVAMSVATPVDTKVPPLKLDAVYLPMPGSMGGGGGNPSPATPRPIEVPQHDMPQPLPVVATPVAPEPPKPVIDVAIETNAAKLLQYSGVGTISLGRPGGGGPGDGAGPGRGRGLGPGADGNTGNGPRQGGGDVTEPTLIRSIEPKYTSAALVAKLTGTCELEVVVLANGTVGQVRVTKSLDAVHGLDQEAIIAARQWLFRPGTQGGRPVDVMVKLVLEFHLR